MKANKRYVLLVLSGVLLAPWITGCSSESVISKGAVAPQGSTSAVLAAQPAPPPMDGQVLERVDPPPMATSAGLDEIIKLAKSGVDENVMVSFVDNSSVPYDPSAEEILYLTDVGVSSRVISAMLRRGRQVREQQAQAAAPAAEAVQSVATNEPAAAETAAAVAASSAAAPVEPPAVETPMVVAEPAPAETQVVAGAAPPQVVYQAPPDAPQQVTVFYDALAPYGSWINVAGYGWCWQPTVVTLSPGWSPYCDGGRWIYTDCGWYWQSDYSWGWAPFHYGRWFRHHHCGWVWVADSVWGPSWVSWRYHDSYCGWAPLPPGAYFHGDHGRWSYFGVSVGVGFSFGLGFADYTFIHARHMGVHGWHQYRLDHDRVRTVYRDSVVINNYIRGNNNVIVNGGIGNERINRYRKDPLRPIMVRDYTGGRDQFVKADRVERVRGQDVVYRRQAQSPISDKPQFGSSSRSGQAGAPSALTATPGTIERPLPTGSAGGAGRAASSDSMTRSPGQPPQPGVSSSRSPSVTAAGSSTSGTDSRSMAPLRSRQENQAANRAGSLPRNSSTASQSSAAPSVAAGSPSAPAPARLPNQQGSVTRQTEGTRANSATARVPSASRPMPATTPPTSTYNSMRTRQEQPSPSRSREASRSLPQMNRNTPQSTYQSRQVENSRTAIQTAPQPAITAPQSTPVYTPPATVNRQQMPSQAPTQRSISPAPSAPRYNSAAPAQSYSAPRNESPRQTYPTPNRSYAPESRGSSPAVSSPRSAPSTAPSVAPSSRGQSSSSSSGSSRSSQESSGRSRQGR